MRNRCGVALASVLLAALLVLTGASGEVRQATAAPGPSGGYAFSNSAVADLALRYAPGGDRAFSRSPGWPANWGGNACQDAGWSGYTWKSPGTYSVGTASDGQCRAFVNCILKMLGVNAAAQDPLPGSVQVSIDQAMRGDVIQTGNPHTMIVLSNDGGGNFTVVDSNWGSWELVSTPHSVNLQSFAGSSYTIYRFGQARLDPPTVTYRVQTSRVTLSWPAVSGAALYTVTRDGYQLASRSSTTFTDTAISYGQTYHYRVTAISGTMTSSPAVVDVRTLINSADRAWLRTANGPALCGRAGDGSYQALVCTVVSVNGSTKVVSPAVDWGYPSDRAWVPLSDGSVSYCRRVGTGFEARCTKFTGSAWLASVTSASTDPGYGEDRTWLPTKNGPALCGRAGEVTNQRLVCTVVSVNGSTKVVSPAVDWGYPTDRAWVPLSDGSVSYCRRVGTGFEARCTKFTGSAWLASVTSASTDPGYGEDRTWVATANGPALCGRAGDGSYQALVCTVVSVNGATKVVSPAVDWGYPSDRAWVPLSDGSVSYCRRIGTGNQGKCTKFTGSAWLASATSTATDPGYQENRTWVATANGPALCGRAGDGSYQALVCTVVSANGASRVVSPAVDWGYAADRAWVRNAEYSLSYCRLVGTGNQGKCTKFTGSAWLASVTSAATDPGYS